MNINFLQKLFAAGFTNSLTNHIVVTMRDGSTSYGTLVERPALEIPFWMYCDEMHPTLYFIFIRIADRHFATVLNKKLVDNDLAENGPMDVQINIGNGQCYSAESFQAYNVKEHVRCSAYGNFPGNFPTNNHIYVSVPRDQVYSSVLEYRS